MTLPEPRTILPSQAGASCAMAGLIRFVQLVQYPAYRFVGAGEFPRYQTHHQRATSCVVGPPMLVELAAAVALVIWPVAGMDPRWAGAGPGLPGPGQHRFLPSASAHQAAGLRCGGGCGTSGACQPGAHHWLVAAGRAFPRNAQLGGLTSFPRHEIPPCRLSAPARGVGSVIGRGGGGIPGAGMSR